MADDQLRQLARRFQETGSVTDEAAWLQARRRRGELGDETLALATWLGSKAARKVLGAEAPRVPYDPEGWVGALFEQAPAAIHDQLVCRAAAAAIRHLVPHYEATPERCARHGTQACKHPDCSPDLGFRRVLEACERHVAAPSDARAEGLAELRADVQPPPADHYRWDSPFYPSTQSPSLAHDLAERLHALHFDAQATAPSGVFDGAVHTVRRLAEGEARERSVDRDYLVGESLDELRKSLCADLLPWVLGSGDPLAERAGLAVTELDSQTGSSTDRQRRYVVKLARRAGLDEARLLRRIDERFGKPAVQALDKDEAAELLDALRDEARLREGPRQPTVGSQPSERQLSFLWGLVGRGGIRDDELSQLIHELTGKREVVDLTRAEVSKVIGALRARVNDHHDLRGDF